MNDVRRGRLKVYLGAAPGVGKTYRMLDEGRRRAGRGADVVVAFAECHGRPRTEAMLDGLETVRRTECTYRGGRFEEMDLGAVLARRPEVAIVDEFAHTNVPGGGRNPKRWQDIEALLAAGTDVITAVNVQHLESLKDVVEKITGVPQHETVPDEVVRRARQIELVDIPPEGLRRRMAHGNIYAPEKIDAALANYFRPGNLTALRQLALLWVADRVDEALNSYRAEHAIGTVWETRERVVVALTGGPEGDTLIRRAARIADRSAGGELLAVHVARSDGLAAGVSHASLARQRRLVEDLGGSYHSVVGDDVAASLVEFARAENATQLVLGASRRGRLERFLTGLGTGETVVALSGDIDVHRVTHEQAGRGTLLPSRRRTLSTSRRIAGPVAGLVLPFLLTAGLAQVRGTLNLTSEALLFLLSVVGVACIGGVVSAVIASVTASLLLNYWFIPPIGQFTLDDPNALIALAVFAVVAATVAAVVDRSLRLSRRAARATAEAETMSSLAGSIVRGGQTIPALLERTRETFGMESAELVDEPPDTEGATVVPAGPGAFLALRGRTLSSSERRVLAAFAAHVGSAVERARLAEAAAEIEPVRAADRMRTALLRAVGHDLRTPLAAGWAAVTSLRSRDVEFSAADRDELLATADESMAKLNRLVENLLDLSRLEAGVLKLNLRATALEEVLPAALMDTPDVEVGDVEAIPAVLADPPLLERVIANLVGNAARHTAAGAKVLVTASALAGRVELRVVDRGPGLPSAGRDRLFEPFQRLGDTDNSTGLGLGLALSRGLTEAMDGTLTPEDTPGGGLTMVVSLPLAERTGRAGQVEQVATAEGGVRGELAEEGVRAESAWRVERAETAERVERFDGAESSERAAGVECTGRIDVSERAERAGRRGSAEPSGCAGRVERGEPAESAEPAAEAERPGRTEVSGPAERAGLRGPVELSERAEQLEGVEPAAEAERPGRTEVSGPAERAGPREPAEVSDPAAQAGPRGPVEPPALAAQARPRQRAEPSDRDAQLERSERAEPSPRIAEAEPPAPVDHIALTEQQRPTGARKAGGVP